MAKHGNSRLYLVNPSSVRLADRLPRIVDVLWLLLYLAALPLRVVGVVAKWCVSFGVWLVESAVRCLFGLLGLLVLAHLVFGLGYVLFYPLLHR